MFLFQNKKIATIAKHITRTYMRTQKQKGHTKVLYDLLSIEDHPISGVSIWPVDPKRPLELRCNLKIEKGIYKDIILHLIIRVPGDYPERAPTVNIAPGLEFDKKFLKYIVNDQKNGHSF